MILRTGIISRRQGLDPRSFAEHWKSVHGKLACKMPRLRSYRQNHIVARLYEMRPSPIQVVDGFSQLRFDSIEDMEFSERSPEYAAVRDDIANFQGGITILVVEPQELHTAARGPAAKLLCVSRARSDAAECRSGWSTSARAMIEGAPEVRKIVQNWVIDKDHPVSAGVPQGAPDVDALTELWFDDSETLARAVNSSLGKRLFHSNPWLEPVAIYEVAELVMV